jgi:hypothetical protein
LSLVLICEATCLTKRLAEKVTLNSRYRPGVQAYEI